MYNDNLKPCGTDQGIFNQKVLDFELDGSRFVRLYLGAPDCTDYWGDDWDDTPYEHNAGTVYPQYVTHVMDIALPCETVVIEPCAGHWNSPYCKGDMKARRIPCLVFTTDKDKWGGDFETFEAALASPNAMLVHMGDNAGEVFGKLQPHVMGIRFYEQERDNG